MTGNMSGIKLDGVSADRLLQKLDENVVTYKSLDLGFKKRMSELVSDNADMAAKVSGGAKGYWLSDMDNIIYEYNMWYEKQFPGKVKYLPIPASDPVELVPFGDDLVSLSSKEDLKNYLSQKVWEPVSITSYDRKTGRIAVATSIGVDKLKAEVRYYPYELSDNGDMMNSGTGAKWDTRDGSTVTMNGADLMTHITNTTTSTFVADVKRGGIKEVETIMFRMVKN